MNKDNIIINIETIVKSYNLKYERTNFENAFMIDIWGRNKFITIQITQSYIGFSNWDINSECDDFSTTSDKYFENENDFILFFKNFIKDN